MAAETPLHDMGAISITASDSLGTGRMGETIRRTWQMAHAMHMQAMKKGTGDLIANERVLRYLAKYTINPAIAHGMARHVGTLEPGKLADVVLWRPECFGVKPNLVVKGGMPAWGAVLATSVIRSQISRSLLASVTIPSNEQPRNSCSSV